MGILTQIKNIFSGAVSFEAEVDGETESIRLGRLVKLAYERNTNLEDVNLRHANLRHANLEGAKLEGSDLRGAKLEGAKLGDSFKLGADRPLLQIGNIGSNS